MKDYNSNNNPNLYRGSNKNVFMNKNNKIKRILTKKKGDKSQHFMSYDVRSSLNKYEIMNQPCLTETSMDSSMRKTKKRIKNKRNSSITKIQNTGKHINIKQNQGSSKQTTDNYGGIIKY